MTDTKALITVIIPTFRRPKSLRRAIVSVLNQTFPAFQVCVYDDASNDDTQQVVTELAETDSRIKYYCHERNVGVAANFNYGLQRVNTPFFSFLSDDDLLLPHFFEVAMQSLSAKPDAMFYAGLTIQVEDHTVTGVSKNGGRFGYLPPPDSLLDIADHQLLWNSIVFRSEVKESVGLLDIDVGGPADVDFLFRIAAHHPVIISTEPGAIYTLHAHNFYARSSDYRLYLPGFKRLINKMMSDESLSFETRIQAKDSLNAWLANLLVALAVRASLRGEYDNVSALAEILARSCNKKAKALLLVGRSKLKESSEPAFLLVSRIARWLRLIFPPYTIHKIKLRQLQRKYRGYLRYLDT
ncbi:MAG: glycosyltransferase family 2 protein [Halobacteriota archaeon]